MKTILNDSPVQRINSILDFIIATPKHIQSVEHKHQLVTIHTMHPNIIEKINNIRISLSEMEKMYDDFMGRQSLGALLPDFDNKFVAVNIKSKE